MYSQIFTSNVPFSCVIWKGFPQPYIALVLIRLSHFSFDEWGPICFPVVLYCPCLNIPQLSFSIRTGSLQCGHVMTSFIIVLIFILWFLIKYLNQFFWRCSCEDPTTGPDDRTRRPKRVPSLRASPPLPKPPRPRLLFLLPPGEKLSGNE